MYPLQKIYHEYIHSIIYTQYTLIYTKWYTHIYSYIYTLIYTLLYSLMYSYIYSMSMKTYVPTRTLARMLTVITYRNQEVEVTKMFNNWYLKDKIVYHKEGWYSAIKWAKYNTNIYHWQKSEDKWLSKRRQKEHTHMILYLIKFRSLELLDSFA